MNAVWRNKKLLYWKISLIGLFFVTGLIYFAFISFVSLFEPLKISYSNYLPRSATDICENTEYIQSGPDEEYRYYLKAKVSEQEFIEFIDEIKARMGISGSQERHTIENSECIKVGPTNFHFLICQR